MRIKITDSSNLKIQTSQFHSITISDERHAEAKADPSLEQKDKDKDKGKDKSKPWPATAQIQVKLMLYDGESWMVREAVRRHAVDGIFFGPIVGLSRNFLDLLGLDAGAITHSASRKAVGPLTDQYCREFVEHLVRELARELSTIRGFKTLSESTRASLAWIQVLKKGTYIEDIVKQKIDNMLERIEAEKNKKAKEAKKSKEEKDKEQKDKEQKDKEQKDKKENEKRIAQSRMRVFRNKTTIEELIKQKISGLFKRNEAQNASEVKATESGKQVESKAEKNKKKDKKNEKDKAKDNEITPAELLDIWKTLLDVKPESLALMLAPLRRHYVLFVGNLLEDIVKLPGMSDAANAMRKLFANFVSANNMQDQKIFSTFGDLLPPMTAIELMEELTVVLRELGEMKKSICGFC